MRWLASVDLQLFDDRGHLPSLLMDLFVEQRLVRVDVPIEKASN